MIHAARESPKTAALIGRGAGGRDGARAVVEANLRGVGRTRNGVAAISPTNAWTVGFAVGNTWGTNRSLIAHWNGTSWTRTTSPNPSASGVNNLWSIYAASANDVWAVGEYGSGASERTLAIHW